MLNSMTQVLRMIAEGRVRWAFWPPGTDPKDLNGAAGTGIWIPHDDNDTWDERESEEEEDDGKLRHPASDSGEEGSDDESEEHDEELTTTAVGSRFGALHISSDTTEDEEDGEDSSTDEI